MENGPQKISLHRRRLERGRPINCNLTGGLGTGQAVIVSAKVILTTSGYRLVNKKMGARVSPQIRRRMEVEIHGSRRAEKIFRRNSPSEPLMHAQSTFMNSSLLPKINSV